MSEARYFIDRYERGERTVLVHIEFYRDTLYSNSLREFNDLAESAGGQILALLTIKKTKPEPQYFVGTGKAEEIQSVVHDLKAEVVIFNHDLSPSQERNLEKLFQCRVLGRTGLILDIFAQRAQSFEGKLQVELAQLKHLSTRLVRGWTHLERQRGGIGLRGPGETQLETDRRLLDLRIKAINQRLVKVQKQREQGRRARKRADIPIIALVGYTNAGKSTLFNAMTSGMAYTADQLFATLDPTFRQIELPLLGKVIFVDTVGFIQNLPHDLVVSFRATLEETRQADLLLHVVDAHAPTIRENIQAVQEVLKELEVTDIPQLLVYNKIDLAEERSRVDYDREAAPHRVWLSAVTQDGLSLLSESIVHLLSGQFINCDIILKPEQGALRAAFYELNAVQQESTDAEGHIHLVLKIQRKDYQRLCQNPVYE